MCREMHTKEGRGEEQPNVFSERQRASTLPARARTEQSVQSRVQYKPPAVTSSRPSSAAFTSVQPAREDSYFVRCAQQQQPTMYSYLCCWLSTSEQLIISLLIYASMILWVYCTSMSTGSTRIWCSSLLARVLIRVAVACSDLKADTWQSSWNEGEGLEEARPTQQPWGIDEYVPGHHCSILGDGSQPTAAQHQPSAQPAPRRSFTRTAHARSVRFTCVQYTLRAQCSESLALSMIALILRISVQNISLVHC